MENHMNHTNIKFPKVVVASCPEGEFVKTLEFHLVESGKVGFVDIGRYAAKVGEGQNLRNIRGSISDLNDLRLSIFTGDSCKHPTAKDGVRMRSMDSVLVSQKAPKGNKQVAGHALDYGRVEAQNDKQRIAAVQILADHALKFYNLEYAISQPVN